MLVAEFIKPVTNIQNSHLKKLARQLLEDFLVGFIQPLKAEIESSQYQLSNQVEASSLPDGSSNPLKNFPVWGSSEVPPQYLPRTIERTLIAPEQFEELFNQYASKEAGTSNPFPKSVVHSLKGMRMDVMPGVENRQNLINLIDPWIPNVSEAQNMGEPGTKARFAISCGILEMSERNRSWLEDSKSAFGQLTGMSIASYVNSKNPEIREARENSFVAAFQAMFSLSRPLVQMNKEALIHVKSVEDGKTAAQVMSRASKIPFGINSRVGELLVPFLKSKGEDVSDAAFERNWFDQ
jgi:hypothetical protein